jgi:hypothetical protein
MGQLTFAAVLDGRLVEAVRLVAEPRKRRRHLAAADEMTGCYGAAKGWVDTQLEVC